MFEFEKKFWILDGGIKWFRWFAVVVYGLSLATMACISFSWQQYSLILLQGRAYEWMCSPEEIATRPEFGAAACLKQEKHLGDLYSLLTTAQAASGALAGVFLDHAGRRWCAATGVIMSIISIILLVASSESFQALPAAVFLDGLSCNLIAFPTLVLADYFPQHPVAATSFVLTAEYGGAIVSPVLFYSWRANPQWTHTRLWLIFALCITLPLGCAYVCMLPPKAYGDRKNNEEDARYNARLQLHETTATEQGDESEALAKLEKNESGSSIERITCRMKTASFLQNLKTADFWNFEVVFNLFMIQHTYYPVVLRDMSGESIAAYQGLFQTSQAFWCLFCGALCDYCCTATAMATLAATSCGVFLLSQVRSLGLQYFIVSVFTIAHSYVYAIRFTFVREAFGPEHRGKILGAIGIGSALTTLLNIAINRTTNYTLWNSLMAGITILQAPSIWYLWHRYKSFFNLRAPKKSIPFCLMPEEDVPTGAVMDTQGNSKQ